MLVEIVYAEGLSNKLVADLLLNQLQALPVADSAEPKSIDEVASYGLSITPCTKGKDSVRNGIQLVQAQRCSVTKRSTNIIKEYLNYLWAADKHGALISPNEPEKGFDHSMDAIRYALASLVEYMPAHIHNQLDAQFTRNTARQVMNSTK